jgi:hypothetical protein
MAWGMNNLKPKRKRRIRIMNRLVVETDANGARIDINGRTIAFVSLLTNRLVVSDGACKKEGLELHVGKCFVGSQPFDKVVCPNELKKMEDY